MTLILTSDALTSEKLKKEFRKIAKSMKSKKVLIVHTNRNPEDWVYTNNAIAELESCGISKEDIYLINIALGECLEGIMSFGLVYVSGGNTFFILDKMRDTWLGKEIKKFVKSGGIYLGVSAGSIIAGKSIEVAGWGSEGDPNEIGLKDLKGLGLTDICIFPHYKDSQKEEVEEFRKKVGYPVEALKDGEAIIIEKGKARRV